MEADRLADEVHSFVTKLGLDCPSKHSSFAPKHPVVINLRAIFFRVGNHGASAWTCVPAHSVGNTKPLEIELWYDIRLDSPAMRRQARHMVATAGLVRPK